MFHYIPALRFKMGEYTAVGKLQTVFGHAFTPRFIIPPPNECDPEEQRAPSTDEIATVTGDRICRHYPLNAGYIDPQFVSDSLGDDGLCRLLTIVQRGNPNLIPILSVKKTSIKGMQRFVRKNVPKIGLRLTFDDFDIAAAIESIRALYCRPEDCALFIDFVGAELDPIIATDTVAGILDHVAQSARWWKIIYQASNYPDKNPAKDGETVFIPRHEWDVFFAAVRETRLTSDLLSYGDFGADSSNVSFYTKPVGVPPIRHLRYTTPKAIMVARGLPTGSCLEAMQDVSKRIVESGSFYGRGHCYADDHIFKLAQGQITVPGNPSNWREWNTAHHLATVIRSLGAKENVNFTEFPFDNSKQLLLPEYY